jgi:two-component system response regulator HydG
MAPEPRPRVLVVDDNHEMAEMLAEGLADRGYDAVAVGSGREALARLEAETVDALVTDLRMQSVDGFGLLARSRELDPERPVIIMTAYSAVDSAVEAIRRGAFHYLAKPFKVDELAIFLGRGLDGMRVRREADSLRRVLKDRLAPGGMLGRSKAMREVFELIERLADARAPVLVMGETGTGKGLVAAAIHGASRRASAPFVAVNCAALPENLLESELFGHVRGAFTGASEARPGLFAEAHGGTLFLDEIGEMALPLQAKLLHVLERGKVRPVGATGERDVDVRIVAATNRDLRLAVSRGTFREDLLYRLDVVPITLPPLRERPEDIPELIEHLLSAARARNPQSPLRRLSGDALGRLLDHRWPGNVRELAHLIERLVLLARGEEATAADLPTTLQSAAAPTRSLLSGDVVTMREMQRTYALWALEQVGGVRSRAAEKLDIDIKTLVKLIKGEPGDPPRS